MLSREKNNAGNVILICFARSNRAKVAGMTIHQIVNWNEETHRKLAMVPRDDDNHYVVRAYMSWIRGEIAMRRSERVADDFIGVRSGTRAID
jgi:hypothetical protein